MSWSGCARDATVRGSKVQGNGRVVKSTLTIPVKLCKAILLGLRAQTREDGFKEQGVVGCRDNYSGLSY